MDNKIKVVIDIDKTLFENVVEQTRNGYVGSDVWIAVANGRPCGTYEEETHENSQARPQGEWKIREAKDNDGDFIGHELYCSNCGKVKVRFINRCYTAEEAKEQLKDRFVNFCEDCGADMRGHYSLGGGINSYKTTVRPQAEWICKTKSTFPQYQPDEFECSSCKQVSTQKYSFCPYCSADMGGKEE